MLPSLTRRPYFSLLGPQPFSSGFCVSNQSVNNLFIDTANRKRNITSIITFYLLCIELDSCGLNGRFSPHRFRFLIQQKQRKHAGSAAGRIIIEDMGRAQTCTISSYACPPGMSQSNPSAKLTLSQRNSSTYAVVQLRARLGSGTH